MKIGVITNDETQVFQRQVIHGAKSFFRLHGYACVVVNTGIPKADLDAVGLEWKALAGVLVIANALSDDALQRLHTQQARLTLVSHQVPAFSLPTVLADNVGGMRMLVDYLVREHGRRRIAFIQGDLEQVDGHVRWNTFQRELLRHHIALDERLIIPGEFDSSIAALSTQRLIESGVAFDALAAADYLMALAAMDVLLAQGLRIPEDVCVVGFGDGPEAEAQGLTTVGVDVEKLGVHAAKQLLGQINGLQIEGSAMITTSIIKRHSC